MTGWGVVIYRDGQPVSGVVDADDCDIGSLIAPVFAAWPGGRVSILHAVVGARLELAPHEDQLSLLEEST